MNKSETFQSFESISTSHFMKTLRKQNSGQWRAKLCDTGSTFLNGQTGREWIENKVLRNMGFKHCRQEPL